MPFLQWGGRSWLGTIMDELFGMMNNKLPVVSLQVKKKKKKKRKYLLKLCLKKGNKLTIKIFKGKTFR